MTLALSLVLSAWDLLGPPAPDYSRRQTYPGPVAVQEDTDNPEYVSSVEPRTPEEQLAGFYLPPGFEIQLFAAEPDIGKPMNLAFDERGRLWVTQSFEYPFAAPAGRGRDRVTILEDTNGDGRADRFTVFAEGLNIPIGVAPLTGGAIVYSIPAVYRLFDDDGNDRADRREVLYGGFGHRDTHGMVSSFTRGFDGWLYACHGFTNTSEVRGRDGDVLTMTSGNTFRMRIDGSRVEGFTFGQVNPFGLAFDPLGNLYSADCHSRPVYQLLRGAEYPHFARLPTGIGFGPVMMGHDHGSTAIAGIAHYAARQFPPEYRDNIFLGNVVTNRVNRNSLMNRGATRIAVEQPDFVISDDTWFRPVDLKVGPDGALYIADFYNRIIGHYEVPLNHPDRDRHRGRIWRVVYRGRDRGHEPVAPRSDWSRAGVGELLSDLGHSNLTVRMLAADQLVDRVGPQAAEPVRAMLRSRSVIPFQKIHGLWVLARLGALDRELLAVSARDPDPAVRTHAMRVLEEYGRRKDAWRELALMALEDADAFVQRAAVQALRRDLHAGNLIPLLELRHQTPRTDSHLTYVLRMALRDHLREPDILSTAVDGDWSEADARMLADALVGVDGPESARLLLRHIRRYREEDDALERYVSHAARFLPDPEGDSLVAFARGEAAGDVERRLALFRAYQQGIRERSIPSTGSPPEGTAVLPEFSSAARDWAADLARDLMATGEEFHLSAAFEIAGSIRWRPLESRLAQAVSSRDLGSPVRRAAATALLELDAEKHLPLLAGVLQDGTGPVSLRISLSTALRRFDSPSVRRELLAAIPGAPRRLQTSLAVGLFGSEEGARALLTAVEEGRISPPLLLQSDLEIRIQLYESSDLPERFARLVKDLEPAEQRIRNLVAARRDSFDPEKASPERGAGIFERHCTSCHQVAGRGESAGPHLDGAGRRGLERLLEDILDPSRNVDPAFATTILRLTNGAILAGLLLREEGDSLVLMDSTQDEIRVRREDVLERRESLLSPMPADFAERMTPEEFDDLLAYLLNLR